MGALQGVPVGSVQPLLESVGHWSKDRELRGHKMCSLAPEVPPEGGEALMPFLCAGDSVCRKKASLLSGVQGMDD